MPPTAPFRRSRYNPRSFPTFKNVDPQFAAFLAREFKNVYAGIPYTEVIDIRDFGPSGNGGHDDTTPWQNAINQCPDHSKIVMPPGFQSAITTLTLLNRTDITIEAPHNPRDTYFGPNYQPQQTQGAAQFIGIGTGNMLEYHNSGHCTLRGVALQGGSNAVGIDIDQLDATKTRICTENHFEFVRIVGPSGNRTWKCVSIATSADTQPDSTKDGWNNCEYMRFLCCSLTGNGDVGLGTTSNVSTSRMYGPLYGYGIGGSMTAGSATLTDADGPFTPGMVGLRVRGPWGSGNTLLDTTISAYSSATQVTLAAAAVASASNVFFIVDENYATGLYLAKSYNAKGQRLLQCNVSFLRTGIDSHGGSLHLYDTNTTGNDLDINVQNNQSESSFEIGTNSENSRQHLAFGDSMTHGWSIRGSRYAVGNCNPGYTYIHLGAGFPALNVDDSTSFENQLPFGSAVYNLSRFESAGSHVRSGGTIWDTAITDNSAGIDNVQNLSVYWAEFDVPGGTTLAGFEVRGDPNHGLKFQWNYGYLTSSDTHLNVTATATESGVSYRMNCASSNLTLTVSKNFPVGWWCYVKKIDATANTLTVSGTGCTFDGAASLVTGTQYKAWRIFHVGNGVYDVF